MIQDFADWLVYGVLEFTPHTRLGEAVNFFVYDTVKILFLLYAISLFMGVVNAYFPVERIRVFLTTKKLYGFQYFFAALFGAVTPFCSCSSIPLFIGFVKGGIPLGVTFAFLITSPLVNEVAIALFLGGVRGQDHGDLCGLRHFAGDDGRGCAGEVQAGTLSVPLDTGAACPVRGGKRRVGAEGDAVPEEMGRHHA